jgi:hypothetical protein
MLLITIFVELRVVAGRSRKRAGSSRAVSRRPAVPWPWGERHGQDMARAQHGHGMASANQTRRHYVNKMGKTHSKPLAARHGRGTAWAWHAMCVSALILSHTACLGAGTVLNAFNHHHRFCSHGWALASSRKCDQRPLSWASARQFLQPSFLASSSTPSILLHFLRPRPCWTQDLSTIVSVFKRNVHFITFRPGK